MFEFFSDGCGGSEEALRPVHMCVTKTWGGGIKEAAHKRDKEGSVSHLCGSTSVLRSTHTREESAAHFCLLLQSCRRELTFILKQPQELKCISQVSTSHCCLQSEACWMQDQPERLQCPPPPKLQVVPNHRHQKTSRSILKFPLTRKCCRLSPYEDERVAAHLSAASITHR